MAADWPCEVEEMTSLLCSVQLEEMELRNVRAVNDQLLKQLTLISQHGGRTDTHWD